VARVRSFVALALLALVGEGCMWNPAPRVEHGGQVRLRHEAPPGTAVSVVGDFNGWTAGLDPLHEVGPGQYEATLRLGPGAHIYAFAQVSSDGGVQVVVPEAAPSYIDDDLGSRDGVLQIPGER